MIAPTAEAATRSRLAPMWTHRLSARNSRMLSPVISSNPNLAPLLQTEANHDDESNSSRLASQSTFDSESLSTKKVGLLKLPDKAASIPKGGLVSRYSIAASSIVR